MQGPLKYLRACISQGTLSIQFLIAIINLRKPQLIMDAIRQ